MNDNPSNTPDSFDRDAYIRRLRSKPILELVDAWEDPMPEAVRDLLRAELERKGYRIRSLPPAPESSPVDESELRPVDESKLATLRVRAGTLCLLVLAVVQVAAAVLLAAPDLLAAVYDGLESSYPRPTGATVSEAGLGILFLVLYFWSRSSPGLAFGAGLIVFVGSHGAAALFGLSVWYASIWISLSVVVVMLLGFQAALRLEASRDSSPPASRPIDPS